MCCTLVACSPEDAAAARAPSCKRGEGQLWQGFLHTSRDGKRVHLLQPADPVGYPGRYCHPGGIQCVTGRVERMRTAQGWVRDTPAALESNTHNMNMITSNLRAPKPHRASTQLPHLLLSELAPNATPSKGVHELEYGAKRASGRRHVEDGWGAKAASGGSCRFHGLLLLHPRGTSRGSRHPYQETGACPRPHSSCSHHCTPDNRRHRGPGSCRQCDERPSRPTNQKRVELRALDLN